MTCSLSKEFSQTGLTTIENTFFIEYLPLADGKDVKVYLYGLFLCQNENFDLPIDDIAKNLNLTVDEVKSAFLFWQEFDLVTVTENPFSVIYQPITSGYGKARKYKPEKYTEFCACLQQLFPNRAISVNEYSEYMNIMEIYSIKPDAMLLITQYCIDRKGESISYRYVSKVAKDFGARGINTVEKVEKELSKYVSRTAEIEKINKALNSTKKPDIDDVNLLNKWTNELGFNMESIVFTASQLKKGSFAKLDTLLMELYSTKSFSIEEIERHSKKKKELFEASVKIAKSLSLYFEVIDTVVDNYTSKWFRLGYEEKGLLYIANYCFKQGKNSLENMDKMIDYLYKNGLISFDAISEYFLRLEKNDEFILTLIETLGIKRGVTAWDRENLKNWRDWNFSDEMILEAFKRAVGKASPIPYVNSILGNWKNKNIFTFEDLVKDEQHSPTKQNSVKRGVTVDMVSAKYESLRYEANEKARENLERANSIKGFSELYERYNTLEIELAMSAFKVGATNVDELEKEKNLVKDKVVKLLSSINLKLDDLSPKYRCVLCNDTGFDGISKCSCYDTIVKECEEELK